MTTRKRLIPSTPSWKLTPRPGIQLSSISYWRPGTPESKPTTSAIVRPRVASPPATESQAPARAGRSAAAIATASGTQRIAMSI
jgi:hypothetical protein